MEKSTNATAFRTLSWILDHADTGFFLVTASPQMQKRISELYKSNKVAIYDYIHQPKPYNYFELDEWRIRQESVDIFFILNTQLALPTEEELLSLNTSRDLLVKKQKIWVFFMNKDTQQRLASFAYDFYSYVMQKIHFQDEEEEKFEGQRILEVEDNYNVPKIKEALLRYQALKEKQMALSLEDTPDHQLLSAAVSLSNIAILYKNCADYNNALILFEKVLAIREKVLGIDHPSTATTYNNIANIYYDQREYLKALEWNQKSLEITERILGKDHPSTATTYNNIANIYSAQGEYIKALEWCQKDLEITERFLGKNHPSTATAYNNIASIYSAQGAYIKALEWYQNSLEISESVLGRDHSLTATIYNNIAGICSDQGAYIKALEWYQNSLEIRESVLGKDHPSTAESYNNIANIYRTQGEYIKALEWYKKSYLVLVQCLDFTHPHSKIVAQNMEETYHLSQLPEPFDQWFQRNLNTED